MDFSYLPSNTKEPKKKEAKDAKKNRSANMNSEDEDFEWRFFQAQPRISKRNSNINDGARPKKGSKVPRVFDALKKNKQTDDETESLSIESQPESQIYLEENGKKMNDEKELEDDIEQEPEENENIIVEPEPSREIARPQNKSFSVNKTINWANSDLTKNKAPQSSNLGKQSVLSYFAPVEKSVARKGVNQQHESGLMTVEKPAIVNDRNKCYEILRDLMRHHDSTEPPFLKCELKQKIYTIYEDVKILLSIHYSDISSFSTFFSDFRSKFNFFHRTVESLRDRYKRFLRDVSDKDLKKIVDFVKAHGFYGTLIFQGSKNSKSLSNIDIIHRSKQQEHNSYASNTTANSNQTTSMFTLQQLNNSLEEIESHLKEVPQESNPMEDCVESKHFSQQDLKFEESACLNPVFIRNDDPYQKPQEPCFCINHPIANLNGKRTLPLLSEISPSILEEKIQGIEIENLLITKNFLNGERTVNQPETEADIVRNLCLELAKRYQKTVAEVISDLESFSGYLEDLESAYEANNDNLKWTQLDDEAILCAKSSKDLAFMMLLKYKGRENIMRRMEFKGFEIPFQF